MLSALPLSLWLTLRKAQILLQHMQRLVLKLPLLVLPLLGRKDPSAVWKNPRDVKCRPLLNDRDVKLRSLLLQMLTLLPSPQLPPPPPPLFPLLEQALQSQLWVLLITNAL
jgi:hypothetical protein